MQSIGRFRWTIGALVILGTMIPASVQAAEKATVRIQVIRATKSDQEISPALKPIADALKSSFKFTGYKLLKTESRDAELNHPLKASLAGAYQAGVTPLAREGNKIKLKVEVSEREGDKEVKKLSTTISLTAGRSQLFGGWKLDGDDVLIIAVSAK